MTTRRNNPRISLHMQTALKAGGHTYDALVAVSGLAKESVARWVKQMRALGVLHVEDWADDVRGRKIVPVFRWGEGKDKPRPGRRWTAAETMARMRARRRAEGYVAPAVEEPVAEDRPVSLEDFL
jgi:hypothetical protein